VADNFTLALTEEEIQARVGEIGGILTEDYAGRRPVVVGVLTGALWFLTDLVRQIDLDLDIDFLLLNRFGEGGRIRIQTDTAIPLVNRHVILVEDIVDTGLSLTVLRKMLEERQVESVRCVALLDKVTRRIVEVPLEYRGFEVGDEYLLGYGLDHDGLYRNLRDIWAILDLGSFRADPATFRRSVFPGR
jgi:hypoxanthine phosphoribosyltransferase